MQKWELSISLIISGLVKIYILNVKNFSLKSQLNSVLKDMILCIAAWAVKAVQTIRRARCCRAGTFQGKNAKSVPKSACFGTKRWLTGKLVPKTQFFGSLSKISLRWSSFSLEKRKVPLWHFFAEFKMKILWKSAFMALFWQMYKLIIHTLAK